MGENEGKTGLGRRLDALARATASARPDFDRLYAIGSNKAAPKSPVAPPGRPRRSFTFAAAACLALAAGFALGHFAILAPSESSPLALSGNTVEPGIQNEVKLYLDELWVNPAVQAETVAWIP